MKDKRRRAHAWGVAAEYLGALLLLAKGYSVLAMRHRSYAGEIDIIAVRSRVLAFVEVKARADKTSALESVTGEKRRRIAAAAAAFVATHGAYAQHGLRFDVMMVTSLWNIHHLKDAWRAE